MDYTIAIHNTFLIVKPSVLHTPIIDLLFSAVNVVFHEEPLIIKKDKSSSPSTSCTHCFEPCVNRDNISNALQELKNTIFPEHPVIFLADLGICLLLVKLEEVHTPVLREIFKNALILAENTPIIEMFKTPSECTLLKNIHLN